MTEQLELFTITPTPKIKSVQDPYWDEIVKESAPQHEDDRWNPADFGEVPFKDEDGQLTIFYADDHEPPDPDDYPNHEAYYKAWDEWELRVGAQVSHATTQTPVKSRVGAQVTSDTKKSAPQHDTHWVERYWVERAENKYWYYRYCWMEGRKKQRIYLGSVHSPKARDKKYSVENAIADGLTPQEIKQMLRGDNG
ncbi:DUF4102 domain-containing protein [Nostoc sp. FACHB-110]|uniref:DUF4102 domain-containing protein n=1 Tax=Nostoc sp. FACHB-110 TaxID=2692834 RepID=UPI0016893AC0|nr:DUF4102 domain-containing protein [Nostoc sp. FACHB-110]MBD2438265.1 DUF4102 domain-containing protein [Nostoc sp. FACHB-110]